MHDYPFKSKFIVKLFLTFNFLIFHNSIDSGTIDFSEFIVMMSEQTETPSSSTSEDFREAFKEFDKDGNGIITVKEFKKAMAKCGEKLSDKKVKEMMKKVDEDGDGCINYQGKINVQFLKVANNIIM